MHASSPPPPQGKDTRPERQSRCEKKGATLGGEQDVVAGGAEQESPEELTQPVGDCEAAPRRARPTLCWHVPGNLVAHVREPRPDRLQPELLVLVVPYRLLAQRFRRRRLAAGQ